MLLPIGVRFSGQVDGVEDSGYLGPSQDHLSKFVALSEVPGGLLGSSHGFLGG